MRGSAAADVFLPLGRRLGTVVLSLLLVLVILAEGSSSNKQQKKNRGHNYEEALRKSLLYFEAQRSGRLPHGQRVPWRDHSGLTDGLEQGVRYTMRPNLQVLSFSFYRVSIDADDRCLDVSGGLGGGIL